MNRKELVLAELLKTFPAGSSLALKPDSLELDFVNDQGESYKANVFWSDGIAQLVKVPGSVPLGDTMFPGRWVAIMKQDGQGSAHLRLNDPDFTSRRAIAKQAQKLTFGRPLYVLYFELTNR